MFCHNKTLKWLENKDESVKDKLTAEARKCVVKTRYLFKQRRTEIEEKRKALLREKFLESQERERKRVEKLVGFTNDILDWGLLQSVDQVNRHMPLCETNRELDLRLCLSSRKKCSIRSQRMKTWEMYIFFLKLWMEKESI